MDATEIRNHVRLEERHFWHRERRALLLREVRRLGKPGRVLEIGAAGGGNCALLARHGWQPTAVDISPVATEIARERGREALCAAARALPLPAEAFDLVLALDVLEHIEEDVLAVREMARVLRPGGTALIAVPCDMRLWSRHDEVLGHVRRYTRESLAAAVTGGGLAIERIWSWNVLLRPVVRLRRRRSSGCDLRELPGPVDRLLGMVLRLESHLPVGSLPGVSLFCRARREEP